jgi:hypothetical protein
VWLIISRGIKRSDPACLSHGVVHMASGCQPAMDTQNMQGDLGPSTSTSHAVVVE